VDWDARYRSGDAGPSHPAAIVVEAAALRPPGRALDVACGAGRNARYLAERGWRVIGVDMSVAALQMVNVPAVLADLERDPLPFMDELFDLVCIVNFLHRPLFADARRVLRRGGLVAAKIKMTGSFSLRPDELRSYFSGCPLLFDRDGELIAVK